MLVEGTQSFPPTCESTLRSHPLATTRYEPLGRMDERLLVSARNYTNAAIAAAEFLSWLTGHQELQQKNPKWRFRCSPKKWLSRCNQTWLPRCNQAWLSRRCNVGATPRTDNTLVACRPMRACVTITPKYCSRSHMSLLR